MVEGTTVTVRILDKEYQVSCQPDEVQALKKSATYVCLLYTSDAADE